jgi:hypothetical protein
MSRKRSSLLRLVPLRFDVTGIALASLSLLAICYALVEGQKYNWGTITWVISIPLLFAVGAVLLGLFLYQQARRQDREPLVPFALYRDRNYALMNVVTGFMAIGMLGIFLPSTCSQFWGSARSRPD